MTESVKNELSDICRIIDATVDTEKIYLFGSYAYGTPTDDSDYDLCVIIPENSMRPVDAVKAIRRALLPLQTMSLDILVYRADTFFRRAQGVTMERKIKRDGIPYTRTSPTNHNTNYCDKAVARKGGGLVASPEVNEQYLFGTLSPRQSWISSWTGSMGRP